MNRTDIPVVDLLENIFMRRKATDYGDEPISMSQHMLQTARLAERANADNTTIVAALLHDIGHYANEFPHCENNGTDNDSHELIGAHVIEQWFPEVVTDCIRYHVQAKRFLCSTEKNYYDSLSQACKASFLSQGGLMNSVEILNFRKISTL